MSFTACNKSLAPLRGSSAQARLVCTSESHSFYAADEGNPFAQSPRRTSIMFRPLQLTRPLAGIAVLTTIAACSSDVTGSNRHNVQLSFTTYATVTSSANRVAADLV